MNPRGQFDMTGTIGSMPCERSLNSILGKLNDPKMLRKIMRLLLVTRERLKQLKYIPDKASAKHFRQLLQHDMENRLSSITGHKVRGVPVTDALTSHTMCVMHAYFNYSDDESVGEPQGQPP
jgi:hypothetical protein